MPLYEYLCENCERSFERLSSIAAADEALCPSCGGSETRRLLSVIGGLHTQSPRPTSGCGCGGACSCN
jgi:putative FmdB family regulatory protein